MESSADNLQMQKLQEDNARIKKELKKIREENAKLKQIISYGNISTLETLIEQYIVPFSKKRTEKSN